ncbi:putative reverse transcriptase domain-containing protein [Tanacetum coccineum]
MTRCHRAFKNDDSEGDILFFEELLSNNFPSLLENKSFHFDVPSSPRPPAKPPDDDEIEPDTGILTVKMVDDIFEHYVLKPRILTTQPTLSPHPLSHRGFKAFQVISEFSESPMMIYGEDIPIKRRPIVKGNDVVAYSQRFQELALMNQPESGIQQGDKNTEEAYARKEMVTGDHTEGLNLCRGLLESPKCQHMGIIRGLGFECGAQGISEGLPKIEEQQQWGNQAGNAKAQAKVYAVGNAGANPDNNVVTGMFLLNNRYASILFDTGADRSFVSTAFSSRIIITPTALDHNYNVELADGRIVGLNTIIRGCTLNLLNHPFNIDLMPVELEGRIGCQVLQSVNMDPPGRFIEGFSKIAKSMTKLTQKGVKFDWGDKQEAAFQLLKQKLCSAPILALHEGKQDFIAFL